MRTLNCARNRITLRVHPQSGEAITVLKSHGPDDLWAEMSDGTLRIVPVAWTDWHPPPLRLELEGEQVRLEPAAMKSLSIWIAARREEIRGKKVGHVSRAVAGVHTDHEWAKKSETENKGADLGRRKRAQPRLVDRSALAVVEQAGASDADGRNSGRKREEEG